MRFWLMLVSALAVGTVAGAQSGDSSVVHVDPEKVAAALAKGGTLVTRPDLLVQGSHREAAGQVEVHDKETDVLYIIDGDATFAYGGRMVGGKVSRLGQWLGTDIAGGETHRSSRAMCSWFLRASPTGSRKCRSRSATTWSRC